MRGTKHSFDNETHRECILCLKFIDIILAFLYTNAFKSHLQIYRQTNSAWQLSLTEVGQHC
jgi:hypothetical protein